MDLKARLERMLIKCWQFIKRNVIWALLIVIAYLGIAPETAEIKTFFIIIGLEGLAILLSGLANYAYTKLDFTYKSQDNLGRIFIGVHLLIGLILIGYYFTVFSKTIN